MATPRTSRALQIAGVTVSKCKRRLTLDEALTKEVGRALTDEVVDEPVDEATTEEGSVEGGGVEQLDKERQGVEPIEQDHQNNDPLIDMDCSTSSSSTKQKRKLLASTLAMMKKYKLQRKACRRFKISRNLLKTNKKRQGRKKVSLSTVKEVKNFYEVNVTQLPDTKFVSKQN